MRDLVIIGAGGFAREVAWLIEDNNRVEPEWNILGFVSEKSEQQKYPILGNDNWLLEYSGEINAVCCVGDSIIRKKIINKFQERKNIHFPNIVSKHAVISDSVKLGSGIVICAGTIMTVNITIGNFCIINLNCTVGHDAVLDSFVTINPGVNISGNVHIGSKSEIGTGTKIIQGVTIGPSTIIGAGASVIKDLEGNCTAVGVPAKMIKMNRW